MFSKCYKLETGLIFCCFANDIFPEHECYFLMQGRDTYAIEKVLFFGKSFLSRLKAIPLGRFPTTMDLPGKVLVLTHDNTCLQHMDRGHKCHKFPYQAQGKGKPDLP